MSKNLILGLFVMVLVLGGGYLYSSNNQQMIEPEKSMDKTETSMVKDTSPKSEDVMTKTEDKMMVKDSRYAPYTKELLENTKSSRRVLYFYASWCSTCIPANSDFEKNISMIPEDVTVIRVNYNDPDTDADEKALAVKYGITYQHTFVQIDSAGKLVTQWNGGAIKELLVKIK